MYYTWRSELFTTFFFTIGILTEIRCFCWMSSDLHEIDFAKFKTSHAARLRITKILTLNLQLIENRIGQWRQRYDREKKMYGEGIRKVRNEIEDARRYLEELTTEVMIRKLCDSARNIFIPFPRRDNSRRGAE